MKKLLYLSLIGSALLAFLISPAQAEIEQPMLGEPAPGFDLPAVNGDPVSLSSLRGKYVVIHFAASW